MKKIMTALSVIALAICANAATTKWAITTGANGVYGPGTTDLLSGNLTAYVFCSETADTATTATILTQGGLLGALRNGDNISGLGAVATVTVSNGQIAKQSFTSDDFAGSKSTKMYFAVLVDDNVYISTLQTKTSNVTSEQIMSFNPTTTSQAALNSYATAFGSAGWYATTAAVPEPTSGLLLLLGMAGIALKRKRA